MTNTLWMILRLIAMTALLLSYVCTNSEDEDEIEDCPLPVDDDFWDSFGNGFELETVRPTDPDYPFFTTTFSQDPELQFLPPAATGSVAKGRRRRAAAGMSINDVICERRRGIELRYNSDGDLCCSTKRAECLWFRNITSVSGVTLYPIWRATVDINLKISVQYQTFFDIICDELPVNGACNQCRPIKHNRKVLTSITPPLPLNSTIPGSYGHSLVSIRDICFERFNETTYCRCTSIV